MIFKQKTIFLLFFFFHSITTFAMDLDQNKQIIPYQNVNILIKKFFYEKEKISRNNKTFFNEYQCLLFLQRIINKSKVTQETIYLKIEIKNILKEIKETYKSKQEIDKSKTAAISDLLSQFEDLYYNYYNHSESKADPLLKKINQYFFNTVNQSNIDKFKRKVLILSHPDKYANDQEMTNISQRITGIEQPKVSSINPKIISTTLYFTKQALNVFEGLLNKLFPQFLQNIEYKQRNQFGEIVKITPKRYKDQTKILENKIDKTTINTKIKYANFKEKVDNVILARNIKKLNINELKGHYDI